MGKEARLRQEGITSHKNLFVVAIKTDFSYEVSKVVDGKSVAEKVVNFFYVPLGSSAKFVSSFKTKEEADVYLEFLANSPMDSKQKEIFFSKDFYILEVRYSPDKKAALNVEWAKRSLVKEIAVNIKNKKSAQLL